MGSLLYAHILRRASRSAAHEADDDDDDDADASSCCCCCSIGTAGNKISCFFLGEFRAIFNAAAALAVFKEYEGELGAFGRLRLLPFLSPCRRFISSGVGSEVGVAQFDDIENLQGTADVDWIRGWLARNVGNV